jgi:hypothetical protein
MDNALVKPIVAAPRLAKRPSTTIARTTYRVSKAQSLRMRAADLKAEAAEARKTKTSEKKKARADKAAARPLAT